MKPLWKYTIGLLIEVVIKVLETLTDTKDPVIKKKRGRRKQDEAEEEHNPE